MRSEHLAWFVYNKTSWSWFESNNGRPIPFGIEYRSFACCLNPNFEARMFQWIAAYFKELLGVLCLNCSDTELVFSEGKRRDNRIRGWRTSTLVWIQEKRSFCVDVIIRRLLLNGVRVKKWLIRTKSECNCKRFAFATMHVFWHTFRFLYSFTRCYSYSFRTGNT